MAKNDPALWTVAGIEAALDEACGEMGNAVNYGWVRLGIVYRPKREVSPLETIREVRGEDGDSDFVELWATIAVDEADVREFLIADAGRSLKPRSRFELRRKIPENYGRTHGMAWYRNDAMDKAETWGNVPATPSYAAAGGYYLVGEYTTPAKGAE